MSHTEYKIFCINCQEKIGQIQAKPVIVCDCSICGFYYFIKSNLVANFDTNMLLEIHLSEKPENIIWNNKNNDGHILSCPFCAKEMKFSRSPDLEGDKSYNCEKCHREFNVDYYA